TGACADKADPSKPAVAEHKGLQQRLSEGGGYKQDENGQWVPKSDKRSQYDRQGDSPYFKGKFAKGDFKTDKYGKKSWWGSKDYGTNGYEGNTDGSRFRAKARQDGASARNGDKKARETGSFTTNSLDRKSARETGASPLDRPVDASVESRRGLYKAPSVIDWKEQRTMSMEQSRGIFGR
ncbi:MAG: hypothetical protein N2A42_05030, partial [Luteolibacter sp.]